MQHIITDEEVARAYKVYVNSEGPTSHADMKEALSDFLNNRPQVGQLRPIAEMSEKPPEGCVRVYAFLSPGFHIRIHMDAKYPDISHALDIQLPTPDPEAEERQRFEEAMKGRMWMPADFEFKNGEYVLHEVGSHYDTWKLAKAK